MSKRQYRNAVSAWGLMTPDERAAFLLWVETPQIGAKRTLIGQSAPFTDIELAQRYADGFQEGREIVSEVQRKRDKLVQHLASITACANCNNGPKTRRMVELSLGHLVSAVQHLKIAVMKTAKHPLVRIDEEALTAIVTYANNIRQLAEQYVTTGDEGTDAAQSALREFINSRVDALKPLDDAIQQAEKRGRQRDEMKAQLGRIAATYPEPERGKAWQIGEAIYHDPHTDPEIQEHLAQYFYSETNTIADKRGLGTYIAEVRKLHFQRHSTNLSQRNSFSD